MHFYYISLLIELLAGYKVSRADFLTHAGFTSLALSDSLTLNARELDTLFSSALDLSNDSQLGLKFGAQISMVPQGILGYALMTSPTIGDALKLLVRYHRALLPSVNIELREYGEELILRTEAKQLPKELSRCYSEMVFAGVLTAGAMLIGESKVSSTPNSTLFLDYPAPKTADLYYALFGQQLQFEQDHCGLHFDNDSLNVNISTSNPAAQEVFRRECERLLPHDDAPGEISERVKKQLISVRLDFPNSAQVAQQLHMSESTLRRQLNKEGTSFQTLLDQVRSKLAHEYLLTTQLPVSEIASLLGFSDSANFRRSFKRWTKETPSEVRQRLT